MEALSLSFALVPLAMWLGVLLSPWRPWSHREVLEAGEPAPEERLGEITVLIPARNEAGVIGRTMASVAAQGTDLRIVLVDDGSTDDTAAIARRAAGGNLRILPGRPLPGGWGGKLWALEQGRRRVDTPLVLLLDADVELAPGVLGSLRAKMRGEGAAFLSLMAMPPMGSFWEKLLMPAFVYFFKLLYPFALSNEPSSNVAAAAGGCILLEARLLEEIDGFESMKDAVIDDCVLARRVKSSGARTWIGSTRSVRSVRPTAGLREIGNMVARTAYTQLRCSVAWLALCTLAMGMAFWAPAASLASTHAAAKWVSAGAWAAMAAAYAPTLRFYGRSLAWALAMPAIGTLFLAMTWSSAIRFWRGERTRWKGRVYDRAMEWRGAPPPGAGASDPGSR